MLHHPSPTREEVSWKGQGTRHGQIVNNTEMTQQHDHTSDSHDNNRTATSQGLEQIPTPKCKLANDLLVEIISCFICCHYVNECRLTCKDVPSTESLKTAVPWSHLPGQPVSVSQY